VIWGDYIAIEGLKLIMFNLDYDPEGEASQDRGDDSDEDESENDLAGTEHYVSVGYVIQFLSRDTNSDRSLGRASSETEML
jgi:hypothetical protein